MLILPVGDPVASGLSALFLDYLLEKVKKQCWCGLTAKSCFLTRARPLWTLTILFYLSYCILAPRHLLVSNKQKHPKQTDIPTQQGCPCAPPLTFLACFSPILLRNSGTRKLCLILSCSLEVLLSPLIPDSLPCLMDQVSLHIQWLTPKALHQFCIRNVFSRHFQLFPPNLSVLSFFNPSVFVLASCIVSLLRSLPLFGAFSHRPWGGIPKTYVWSWHFSP